MKKMLSIFITAFVFVISFVGNVVDKIYADDSPRLRPLNPKNESVSGKIDSLESENIKLQDLETVETTEAVSLKKRVTKKDSLGENPTVENLGDQLKSGDLGRVKK